MGGCKIQTLLRRQNWTSIFRAMLLGDSSGMEVETAGRYKGQREQFRSPLKNIEAIGSIYLIE